MSNEEKLLSIIKDDNFLIDNQEKIINNQQKIIEEYKKFNESLMSANSGAELFDSKVLTLTKSINLNYKAEYPVQYADYEYLYIITSSQKEPFDILMRGEPVVDSDLQYFERLGYKIVIERDKEKE